jgi:hypothetical protein
MNVLDWLLHRKNKGQRQHLEEIAEQLREARETRTKDHEVGTQMVDKIQSRLALLEAQARLHRLRIDQD